MNAFSSHWLALREPLDHAARNSKVVDAVIRYFEDHDTLAITDIAGGTGSTLRALDEKLGNRAHWHLIDNDPALLALAEKTFPKLRTTMQCVDLSETIEPAIASGADLVTTSAFLDLVSKPWLNDFVSCLARADLPFYAAITYNGHKSIEPHHPFDAEVFELFDTHQQTDKGFGPAMGPMSADFAVAAFSQAGYVVTTGNSDWTAGDTHKNFQKELLEGWYQAALELSPELADTLNEWLAFRNQRISDGSSRLVVGHTDFFAAPG